MTFTAEEKMNCALRELKMRKSVYPRWIEQGRMMQGKADYETAVMAAIVEDYRVLAAEDRLI